MDGQEVVQVVGGERLAYGDARADGAGDPADALTGRLGAQVGRAGGVDLTHGVVELPDAGEARCEGHVGEGQVGGLDQHPGGLGATGAGERQRAGAVLLRDHPVELPRRVAQGLGETVDSLALHDAIGDEPHRTGGDVGGDIPLRRPRGRVGQAPAAGPVAGPLRRRRGVEERHVLPARGDRRARGPAIDARGAHGRVEDPVETTVPPLHGPVARVLVQLHVHQSGRRDRQNLAGIGRHRFPVLGG
jgi:hypothetical protein